VETAGSGIVHQEMPKGEANGSMHGFQLWANLPVSLKMTPPKYRDITADKVPEVLVQNGVRIKVIAGNIGGGGGRPHGRHCHLRFLLLTGKPLKEPVAWQGPIVMNTQEELTIAFQEYQEGRFLKT
jgi:redox-sensitive bicupin YhaK (pirin superfamily)